MQASDAAIVVVTGTVNARRPLSRTLVFLDLVLKGLGDLETLEIALKASEVVAQPDLDSGYAYDKCETHQARRAAI